MNTLLFVFQVFLITSGVGVVIGFALAVYLLKHSPEGEETAEGFVENSTRRPVERKYPARVPVPYASGHTAVEGSLHGSRPAW